MFFDRFLCKATSFTLRFSYILLVKLKFSFALNHRVKWRFVDWNLNWNFLNCLSFNSYTFLNIFLWKQSEFFKFNLFVKTKNYHILKFGYCLVFKSRRIFLFLFAFSSSAVPTVNCNILRFFILDSNLKRDLIEMDKLLFVENMDQYNTDEYEQCIPQFWNRKIHHSTSFYYFVIPSAMWWFTKFKSHRNLHYIA
jgi:hypothetical protein